MNSALHSFLCLAYISILLSAVVEALSTATYSDGTYLVGRFAQCHGQKSQTYCKRPLYPTLSYHALFRRQRAALSVSLAASLQGEEDNDGSQSDTVAGCNNLFLSSRRSMLEKGSAPLFVAILNGHVTRSYAEEKGEEEKNNEGVSLSGLKRELVRGTVSLKSGVENEAGSSSALYVTARPDRPDNVPRAILDGTGGKAPPVLAARFPNPSFPFDVSLTASDLTAEGASGVVDGGKDLETATFWWEGEDLVVSARLDSDGVANTRDPTDLVGRGFLKRGGSDGFKVELQGRGIGGKFFTGAKK